MGDDSIKIDDPIKKTKKKVKKVCKCGFGWGILGIIILVIGIALLVNFEKYWGDDAQWQRGLAYTGVAFVILGFILLCIGLSLCVILVVVYKKITGDHSTKTMFKPPKYEYGKAPYPQQPPFNPEPPPRAPAASDTIPAAAPSAAPSAPPKEDKPNPNANPGEVHVEISEHHKF